MIHGKLLAAESLGETTALSADQVTHLLDPCPRTTYFIYKGEYYQQKDGAVMGSPVSSVLAYVHMEMFEDLAPRIWKRYVDYTFCVIERNTLLRPPEQLTPLHPVHLGAGGGWKPSFLRHTFDKKGGWQD